MTKKFTAWIWTTIAFQLLTAAMHAMSFIIKPAAENSTEQQMLNLMNTYKMNMGNGIFRTYSEIVISLSINLTLLCIFGGLINWFLRKNNPGASIWKGVLLIESIIFGILLIVLLAVCVFATNHLCRTYFHWLRWILHKREKRRRQKINTDR